MPSRPQSSGTRSKVLFAFPPTLRILYRLTLEATDVDEPAFEESSNPLGDRVDRMGCVIYSALICVVLAFFQLSVRLHEVESRIEKIESAPAVNVKGAPK